MVETPAELPFIRDQVVCLSHDQAARSGPRKDAPVLDLDTGPSVWRPGAACGSLQPMGRCAACPCLPGHRFWRASAGRRSDQYDPFLQEPGDDRRVPLRHRLRLRRSQSQHASRVDAGELTGRFLLSLMFGQSAIGVVPSFGVRCTASREVAASSHRRCPLTPAAAFGAGQ
jgi:hypothetical protein